jgi:hypothetical protein
VFIPKFNSLNHRSAADTSQAKYHSLQVFGSVYYSDEISPSSTSPYNRLQIPSIKRVWNFSFLVLLFVAVEIKYFNHDSLLMLREVGDVEELE